MESLQDQSKVWCVHNEPSKSNVLASRKRLQRSRTIALPSAGPKAFAAPVAPVEVDTPTYLEVPDFQRVAILGDYASGVLCLCCFKRKLFKF